MPENIDKHRASNRRGNPAWIKGGSSPNPNGRPKKERTLINIAEEILKETVSFERDGKVVSMGMAEAVVRRWLTDCIRGEAPARKELLDRLYGKALESIEVSGGGKEPLVLKVVYDNGDSRANRKS